MFAISTGFAHGVYYKEDDVKNGSKCFPDVWKTIESFRSEVEVSMIAVDH